MANKSFFKSTSGKLRRSESGFTLVETSISLVILMIVGLGAASLFTYATRNNSGANDRELAMAIAQKRLEWMRTIPFTVETRNQAFSYPNGGLGATNPAGVTETIIGSGRTYQVTTVITNIAAVPAGDPEAGEPVLKSIAITVAPQGAETPLGSVTLTTERSTRVPGQY